MRHAKLILCGAVLFGTGYVAGTADVEVIRTSHAQPAEEPELGLQLADETMTKIHDAKLSLQDAQDALSTEGRYESITDGLNSFLILAGGGNAMEELESGQGIDPETFAAIYAGMAIPEVADHLAKDNEGRITYKGKVIRMYSESRLQKAFKRRMRLTNPGQ